LWSAAAVPAIRTDLAHHWSGDFNHDGFADILWQNDDGAAAI
jgi:hypothetical protein